MRSPKARKPSAFQHWRNGLREAILGLLAHQLLSLRHLCRVVDCEANSAREIAEEIRKHSAAKRKRQKSKMKITEDAAYGGHSLSPAG